MSKYAGRIMKSTIQLPKPGMIFHNYKALCAYLNEPPYRDWETDRKSTRLNSSHITRARMPSSA